MEGQARNRVAHTLSALERWDDAYAAYAEALAVWESLQHPNRFEAKAGRAVAAGQLARTDESLALAGEVVDCVATAGLQGLVEPVSLSLNCAAVLTETGQPDRARQVVQQAAAWVQMIAGRISDGEIRKSYLHNRPDNQLLASRT
jgi:hypothetical protein